MCANVGWPVSEVYVQAAAFTSNATWLEAATLFDRRCFTAPLALAGALHPPQATLPWGPAGQHRPFAQGAEEAAAAEATMRGMHANAQLAYVLGAAAHYETVGEPNARLAVEAYFRAIQSSHTYLAGAACQIYEPPMSSMGRASSCCAAASAFQQWCAKLNSRMHDRHCHRWFVIHGGVERGGLACRDAHSPRPKELGGTRSPGLPVGTMCLHAPAMSAALRLPVIVMVHG